MSALPAATAARSGAPGWRKLAVLFLSGYAVLLFAVTIAIPLRIPEILGIAAIHNPSRVGFWTRIAEAPDPSVLYPLFEAPFVLLTAPARLPARLLSLVLAVAAAYFFLELTRRIPLKRSFTALALFMLLPLHFASAYQARSYELALLLVVLATGLGLRLIFRPGVRYALLYGACLTAALYADRDSFLPAVGYLLFLFRFVYRKGERRATWYVLAASVPPVLFFLPYALWASSHTNPNWFADRPVPIVPGLPVRLLRSVAPEHWASYTLCLLLLAGLAVGCASSFRLSGGPIGKRIRLFVLVGGPVATVLLAAGFDLATSERFSSSQLLFAAPAAVLVIVAGLEWLERQPVWKSAALPVTAVLFGVFVAADVQLLFAPDSVAPQDDTEAVAAAIPGELSGDSCVVFVSERMSRALFLVFEPDLLGHECQTFFHHRIVLASHPYVLPAQQADAESYFRGLNFREVKRRKVGGGQIIVLESEQP